MEILDTVPKNEAADGPESLAEFRLLRLKVAELDKYRRECSRLNETVTRLEQDCEILREREQGSREKIQSLSEEIVNRELEYSQKFAEFSAEILKWKRRYEELDIRASRIEEENLRLVEEDRVTLSQLRKRRAAKTAAEIEKASGGTPGEADEYDVHEDLGMSRNTKSFIKVSEGNDKLMVADIGLRSSLNRNSENQRSPKEYGGSIFHSCEQEVCAKTRAEKLQRKLNTNNPSVMKSLSQTDVSSPDIVLPREFCMRNIPAYEIEMILEDEKGSEYEVIYTRGDRTCLSGWRHFTEDHHLEIGDFIVLELIKLTRFKVHIIRANQGPSKKVDGKISKGDEAGAAKRSKTTGIGNTRGSTSLRPLELSSKAWRWKGN